MGWPLRACIPLADSGFKRLFDETCAEDKRTVNAIFQGFRLNLLAVAENESNGAPGEARPSRSGS